MNAPLDEKSLRKAWLKRKFASWEYHEELLKLHDEYLTALHRHWAREDIQKQYPGDYKAMQSPVFFNFDRAPKPGETPKSQWKTGRTVGWADAISYNFNRGMDYAGVDEYAGMADDLRNHLNKLVALMLRYSQNIRRTVEGTWEKNDPDTILNERYTGPIDWPSNWRDDVADLAGTAPHLSIEAGQPCPREGWWFTPAKAGSRRFFVVGQVMPAFTTDYGATLWQWDEQQ
jgi:hypothetical protein